MMKQADKHPGRKAMLRAIQTGDVPFAAHLNRCGACRLLWQLLSAARGDGSGPLDHADPEAVSHYAAIPGLTARRRSGRPGAIAFDSWRGVSTAQLRDVPVAVERHLTLTAGAVTLDMTAEKQADGYEFVARAYRGGTVTTDFVLVAGRLRLVPDRDGYYYWSAKRPGGTIRLVAAGEQIDFERISWRTAQE